MKDEDDKRSEEEIEVINFKQGYLLVTAPGGCGKTYALTQRVIDFLNDENNRGRRLLCVTFTKGAAEEMLSRIREALKMDIHSSANEFFGKFVHATTDRDISTLHAISKRLLEYYWYKYYNAEYQKSEAKYPVLTDAENKALISKAFYHVMPFRKHRKSNTNYGLVDKFKDHPLSLICSAHQRDNVEDLYYEAARRLYHTNRQKKMGFPKELLLYPEYQEGKVPGIKKNHQKLISDAAAELEKLKLTMKKEVDDEGILEENFVSYKSDFDDLLCNVWDFLNRDKIPPCYDWIQVDEVQDLNKLQLDIIRKLTKKDGKETVVYYGDINQAIFSFMGGCPENVTSLRDEVKEKGGTVVSFNVNHRSSAKLMQYQRHCINHLFRKINKKKSNLISDGERKDIENPVEIRRYKTDRQQNADVVNMAISMLKQNPSECVAILCRTNNECIKFEKSFIKKGETPYRISDETFSSMSGIHEALNEIESRYSGGFPDGLSIYQELNACFAAPGAIVSVFLEYAKRLEESSSYKDPESLLNILSTVTLEDVYGHKVITSGIILSTVHKAKGESFETVIVPSVVKGEYPFNFSKDINEDARVFYVAISRAINKLIITYFDKGRIPYMKKDPVKKTCGKHRLAKVSVRTHTSTDKIFKTEPSDFIVRPRGILCLE